MHGDENKVTHGGMGPDSAEKNRATNKSDG
jgi:hypothetical protein